VPAPASAVSAAFSEPPTVAHGSDLSAPPVSAKPRQRVAGEPARTRPAERNAAETPASAAVPVPVPPPSIPAASVETTAKRSSPGTTVEHTAPVQRQAKSDPGPAAVELRIRPQDQAAPDADPTQPARTAPAVHGSAMPAFQVLHEPAA